MKILPGLSVLALAVTAPAAQLPPLDLPGVREERIMIPMRDGTRLSACIHFPTGKGPWPVVFQQLYLPIRAGLTRRDIAEIATHGYVVGSVNFRGAQLSEGAWRGFRSLGWAEHMDGYDLVEWFARQPWSNGKVGTFGGSQAGYAQNLLAVTRPPHLVCQYMSDTLLSLFHEGYARGGVIRPRRNQRPDDIARNPADSLALAAEDLAHPTYDDYWRAVDCTLHFDKMDVPCFTVGSWYDYFASNASSESFIGRQYRGGPNSRGRQQLILGPWVHGPPKTNRVGELTYPVRAQFNIFTHQIRWFDHFLKGVDNGVERDPPVSYFVMGAVDEPGAPGNDWKTARDWPVPAEATSYYFHAGGKLGSTIPEEEKSSTSYESDPQHPMTLSAPASPGATDARAFEQQKEVRTFTTDPLPAPVEWTGKVRIELFVTSTARDTDFIVRLSDVYPDGRSILVMDGVRRARFRDGWEKEVLLTPGQIHRIAFELPPTSQNFNRGHRIRLTVASTAAPFFAPNPQTGEAITAESSARTVVATNRIFHGRDHASRVIAPVVK